MFGIILAAVSAFCLFVYKEITFIPAHFYNDKRKKKEDIEKTVKVQVKGTTRKKNLTKNGLSFYKNDSKMTHIKN